LNTRARTLYPAPSSLTRILPAIRAWPLLRAPEYKKNSRCSSSVGRASPNTQPKSQLSCLSRSRKHRQRLHSRRPRVDARILERQPAKIRSGLSSIPALFCAPLLSGGGIEDPRRCAKSLDCSRRGSRGHRSLPLRDPGVAASIAKLGGPVSIFNIDHDFAGTLDG
jgi:hypothetical protein